MNKLKTILLSAAVLLAIGGALATTSATKMNDCDILTPLGPDGFPLPPPTTWTCQPAHSSTICYYVNDGTGLKPCKQGNERVPNL